MSFDRNDPVDLGALKSEVTTDPLALGYDLNGPTADILSILNTKSAAYTVSKPNISAADVRSICTYDAYNSLSIDEQEWIRWVTGSNGVDEESLRVTADLRQQLAGDPSASGSIWSPADRSVMNAAMLALIDVEGSRAEDLFGFGTAISDTDWTTARDS